MLYASSLLKKAKRFWAVHGLPTVNALYTPVAIRILQSLATKYGTVLKATGTIDFVNLAVNYKTTQ
jgi:hypothetical protein